MKKLLSMLLVTGLLFSLTIPSALTEDGAPEAEVVEIPAEPEAPAAAAAVVEGEAVEVAVSESVVPAGEADPAETETPNEAAEEASEADSNEETPAESLPEASAASEIAEPIGEAPVEEQPVENAPIEEAPVEEAPAEEPIAVPEGTVEISVEGETWIGGTVRLIAKFKGFDGANTILRWQYCEDLFVEEPVWVDAPGQNDLPEYELVLTEENAAYAWRVILTASY